MRYAIGDIHGHIDKLDRALALIEADGGADAPLIFLGDYTDRGPDSRAVIERLMEGQAAGKPWRFLMGNHDRMFLNFVTAARTGDPAIKSGKGWLHPALGGPATLASYLPDAALRRALGEGQEMFLARGLDDGPGHRIEALAEAAAKAVPDAHIAFLQDLPLHLEEGAHLFVHAGIRPGIPLASQEEEDLIWIREEFLDFDGDFGWIVVHGHTALDYPTHFGNRIDLDGGAAYGNPLVPAVYDGADWHTLEEDGRHRLRPAR